MKYNEATMKDHAIAYMRGKDRLDDISINMIDRLQDANREQFKRIENIIAVQYVTGQP